MPQSHLFSRLTQPNSPILSSWGKCFRAYHPVFPDSIPAFEHEGNINDINCSLSIFKSCQLQQAIKLLRLVLLLVNPLVCVCLVEGWAYLLFSSHQGPLPVSTASQRQEKSDQKGHHQLPQHQWRVATRPPDLYGSNFLKLPRGPSSLLVLLLLHGPASNAEAWLVQARTKKG